MARFQLQWEGQGDSSTLRENRGTAWKSSHSEYKPHEMRQHELIQSSTAKKEEMQGKTGAEEEGREKERRGRERGREGRFSGGSGVCPNQKVQGEDPGYVFPLLCLPWFLPNFSAESHLCYIPLINSFSA